MARRRFRPYFYVTLCLAAAAVMLLSCATPQRQSPETRVIASEELRMRFSGKGAGAGVALASTMGPTGIAIGIAIDEGIAKTIGNVAADELNIPSIVENAFLSRADVRSPMVIEVVRYGFVSSSSITSEDAATPQLHLNVSSNGGEARSLRVPEDVGPHCEVAASSLDLLKSDGQAVVASLTEAAHCARKLWERF